MAKIYCHINQCDASVQHFAILYADHYYTISEKLYNTEDAFTLTSIRKGKRRSVMRQIVRQKLFSRDICRWSQDRIIV